MLHLETYLKPSTFFNIVNLTLQSQVRQKRKNLCHAKIYNIKEIALHFFCFHLALELQYQRQGSFIIVYNIKEIALHFFCFYLALELQYQRQGSFIIVYNINKLALHFFCFYLELELQYQRQGSL